VIAIPYLKTVIVILVMWLVVRSGRLHDLFGGSDSYNWLIGAVGTAALVGGVLRLLL
jgi:hypothetical protein